MKLKTLLSILALLSFCTSFAQDKIYKRDGDVLDVKVKEVGIKQITYSKAGSTDGPLYTINKREVEKIEYENGTEDKFDRFDRMPGGPGSFSRHSKSSSESGLKYGNNIIGIAPLQLTSDNVQSGVGVSASYERVLDKNGIISLYVPVFVSFNTTSNYNNMGYPGTNNTYTTFYFMPGVKLYPTGSQGIIRYAVGPSFVFAGGEQPYSSYDPNGLYTQGVKNYSVFGIMINNSMNVFPTPHIYVGLELGLGVSYYTNAYNVNNDINNAPLVQFNFKVGYRF